jgi:hypothetical protein
MNSQTVKTDRAMLHKRRASQPTDQGDMDDDDGVEVSSTGDGDATGANIDWSVSQPACPSRTEWTLLRVARDIYDVEVEVHMFVFIMHSCA